MIHSMVGNGKRHHPESPATIKVSLLLLTLLLPLFSTRGYADELLNHATYEGNYSLLSITAERKLIRNTDGSYTYRQMMDNFTGLVEEQSHFIETTDNILRPIDYHYRQRFFGRTKAYDLIFDWERMQVHYQHRGRDQTLPLEMGLLDPLLYQLQLQRDLRENKETFDYRFVKKGKVIRYRFIPQGIEQIRFKAGSDKTLKLHKVQGSSKRMTTIWLSPQDHYQIARIDHQEGGSTNRLVLKEFIESPAFIEWLSQTPGVNVPGT